MLTVPEHHLCTICWSTGNGCYILVQIIYFHYILWRSWEREFKILCKVLYRCSWLRAGRCVAPMHFIVNIRRHLWNETTIKRCKLIQPNSEQQEHNCGWKAALDLGWTPVDTAHVLISRVITEHFAKRHKPTQLFVITFSLCATILTLDNKWRINMCTCVRGFPKSWAKFPVKSPKTSSSVSVNFSININKCF